jgi:HTH-type transcriptional regulator/antitoxin HigA
VDRPVKVINEIIRGKRAIMPETAQEIAKALGTTPQFWMNLESAYRLSKVSAGSNEIERRCYVYQKVPIAEMRRREWVSGGTVAELEAGIVKFFGLRTITDDIPIPFAAARTGMAETRTFSPAQLAWLYRGRNLVPCVSASRFKPERFKEMLPRLRALARYPEQVREIPRFLSDMGTKFIVIEHIKGTRCDGACTWLDGTPVVLMSIRMDRIDNFWHTLMHELAHVFYGDALSVDEEADKEAGATANIEKRADKFASNFLVPEEEMNSFLVRAAPIFNATQIAGFAARMELHPGIVAGQVRYRTNDYSLNSRLLVKVREHIVGVALTDGWKSNLKAE